MNTIKRLTIIVLMLLLTAIIITLLMGGFMPIFSIAFGILFLYYTLVYLLIIFLKQNRLNNAIVYLLFIFPMLWAIIDGEGFLDILLEQIHLDMK